MKSFFLNLGESLRSSYWFVPLLMTSGAIALSFGLLALDRSIHIPPQSNFAWLYSGGAAGARSVLSTIASSVITVAGTTFSITIAALSLASSQFGPRLLRGFLRDTGNQIVLGTFIGTFVYCLLILRTVRGEQYSAFVPNLAVTGGVVLSLASVSVLIYFINHVSSAIQASHVITSVSNELHEAIDRLYPSGLAEGPKETPLAPVQPPPLPPKVREICAERSGYLQLIDQDRLVECARTAHGVLEIVPRPGKFVTQGAPLAHLHADGAPPPGGFDPWSLLVNKAFILGPHRTMTQDAGFGIDQLVEVAVRALSPGINDPFTAMTCVDRLGQALSRLAMRPIPSSRRYDGGNLRVIAVPDSFPDFVNAAFDQIRQYGHDSFAVTLRLLEVLEIVGGRTKRAEDRAALRRQADLLYAGIDALPIAEDRQTVASHYARTRQSLKD
jgi:uncharacterized membrane protein